MTNLLDSLNNSKYDFYFLVVDDFLDINLPQLTNFISLSPKFLNITLSQKNSGSLLSHPTTINFIKTHSIQTGHIPAIIPFKPSSKIDLICHQNQWILISNPTHLNRLLEDKIKFVEICHQNNLPIIPSTIDVFSLNSFQSAQKKYEDKLVVQTHFGWAGNSSHLTDNFDDLTSNISLGIMVKYSPYKQGYSLINNCCLTSAGLIQSPPGLQYTGIPSLTSNPLATVGRQWPAYIPLDIATQIHTLTTKFSLILQKLNYRGFFGLDFFVSDNQVFLLECNPRLTASFAFYTDIELKNNLTPLFLFHLAEFTNLSLLFDLSLEQSRFENQHIIGSEITKKNDQGVTIRKFNSFTAFTNSPNDINIDPQTLSQVL